MTALDELAARNGELVKEAQVATDKLVAERELHGKAKGRIEELKAELAGATQAKTVAIRESQEAAQRLKVVKVQLKTHKDQSKKVGSLEASNKGLKERVAHLQAAEKQRMGTPDIQLKLKQAEAKLKDSKASYEALWSQKKAVEDELEGLLTGLCQEARTALQELVMASQAPEGPTGAKEHAKRVKAWKDIIERLGN